MAFNDPARRDCPVHPAGVDAIAGCEACIQAQAALRVQHDLSVALGACDDMDTALGLVLDAALSLESIDSGGVYLAARTGELDLIAHRGLSPSFLEASAHYAVDSPNARLAHQGKVRYESYRPISPERQEDKEQEGLLGLAVIPVMHRERLLALLNLASHTDDLIPLVTRDALETMAQQIGSVLRRLRTAAALRESRLNLQSLFDTVDDLLFVLDDTGRIVRVNAATCELLGYSSDELLGLNVLEVHPPDRRDEAAAIVAEMLAGTCDFCPVPLQARDGSLIPVETHVTAGVWSGKPAIFGMSRPVAARQREVAATAR